MRFSLTKNMQIPKPSTKDRERKREREENQEKIIIYYYMLIISNQIAQKIKNLARVNIT